MWNKVPLISQIVGLFALSIGAAIILWERGTGWGILPLGGALIVAGIFADNQEKRR